jgi:hypothetical protein
MVTYIGMKNGTSEALQEKFQEIKNDILVDNHQDLLNRQEYFTKKYRGNRLNDVNVGIWEEAYGTFKVQIFLRNKSGYLREQFRCKKVSSRITNIEEIGYGR